MRNKIYKADNGNICIEYFDKSKFKKIEDMYEKMKSNPYIPEISFENEIIIMPYCGLTLNELTLNTDDKIKIKLQCIDFVKIMFNNKIAHRDLHTKNVCWDGKTNMGY